MHVQLPLSISDILNIQELPNIRELAHFFFKAVRFFLNKKRHHSVHTACTIIFIEK